MIFPRVCGGFFRISYSEGEVYFQVSTSLTGHWLVLISNYKRDPLTRGNEIMSSKKNSWPDPPYGGSLSANISLVTTCYILRRQSFQEGISDQLLFLSIERIDFQQIRERAGCKRRESRFHRFGWTYVYICVCVCENIDRNLFRRRKRLLSHLASSKNLTYS